MTNEQMDSQLEHITGANHEAARSRQERRNATVSSMVAKNIKEEHEALKRRRKAVYRTAFHFSAVITAGGLIWGLSEMESGSVVPGLVICLGAAIFGIVGSIFDCLGGGN